MSHPRKRYRCYAERLDDGICEAFCIDLNIAVQGESLDEVQTKLNAMIASYVDAACGEHVAHKDQLLNRPAPLAIRLRYWQVRVLIAFNRLTHRAKSAVQRAINWMAQPPLNVCA